MSLVTFQVSVSLDGFMAGPNQRLEVPLGDGGEDLHRWLVELEVWRRMAGQAGGVTNASTQVVEEATANVGAYVMGRNMFGGSPGGWSEDPPWRGWWGDDPPYHTPVFVLTHHPHEPIEMEGGTTFHFVTNGFDAAYTQACETAGERGVDIAGGASTVRQALIAGVIDEFTLDIAPVLLGSGERIFDGVESLGLEPVEALHSPLATHIRYRRAG
jgi:dihydrofolate reductase